MSAPQQTLNDQPQQDNNRPSAPSTEPLPTCFSPDTPRRSVLRMRNVNEELLESFSHSMSKRDKNELAKLISLDWQQLKIAVARDMHPPEPLPKLQPTQLSRPSWQDFQDLTRYDALRNSANEYRMRKKLKWKQEDARRNSMSEMSGK